MKEFKWRHGGGATIEMCNELSLIKEYNELRRSLKTWVIAPLIATGPYHASRQEWLFLIRPVNDDPRFPAVGDRCAIALKGDSGTDDEGNVTPYMAAERVDNPLGSFGQTSYSGYVAFKVFEAVGEASDP